MLLLLVTLFLILSYTLASAESRTPIVSAKAAVLYEPKTKSFLYEKGADLRLPMASTTKIMTALVAIENSSLDEIVTISEEMTNIEGSSAYLKVGEKITMEELLYALMLASANDAAVAIACKVGGSVEDFALLMNERAKSIGLKDTSFKNPHGLDDTEHYTTARELSLIAAEAMKNDLFRKISSTYKESFISEERSRTYVNHNKLLKRYDGCIGVKTGFTKRCGRCLVGAAERDGLGFITVTLDAPNDWNDHRLLFDYGFDHLERIVLAKPFEYSFTLPTVGGSKDTARITNRDGLSLILPKGEYKIENEVSLPRYIIAPSDGKTALGRVNFILNGKDVGGVALYADEDINIKEEKGFLKRILNKLE